MCLPSFQLPAGPGASGFSWQKHTGERLWRPPHFSILKSTHLPNRSVQGWVGLFLIPDVIITSVPSSSGSPHTPGTTPNALSHLPTPAALSSESHTYLSQTTRPTPTAPHVTNSPRPANNYSHSSPSHVVQTAPAADQPRDGHGGLQSATLHPAQGQSPGGRTGDSYGLSRKKREEAGTPTQFISKAWPQLS